MKEVWPHCPVEIVDDSLRVYVTSEDQLDVQPKDTDAPRLLPKPKPAELPEACHSVCPECGGDRTLKAGKQSRKGYRMPDYFPDAEAAVAIARETSERVDSMLATQHQSQKRAAVRDDRFGGHKRGQGRRSGHLRRG